MSTEVKQYVSLQLKDQLHFKVQFRKSELIYIL